MRRPDVPKGYEAVYAHNDNITLCVLVDENGKAQFSGITWYNPKDMGDPHYPYDPVKGEVNALGRALKQFNGSDDYHWQDRWYKSGKRSNGTDIWRNIVTGNVEEP